MVRFVHGGCSFRIRVWQPDSIEPAPPPLPTFNYVWDTLREPGTSHSSVPPDVSGSRKLINLNARCAFGAANVPSTPFSGIFVEIPDHAEAFVGL
jgi:hypothetical protein